MSIRVVVRGETDFPSKFAIGDIVLWNADKVRGRIVDIQGKASVNKSQHLCVEFTYDILTVHSGESGDTLRYSRVPEGVLRRECL